MNKKNIRDMDYILTSSSKFISYIIRSKEAGFRKMFKKDIATHAGILIQQDGFWWVAEMENTDSHDSFKRTSLKSYENGYNGKFIVAVRRNPVYDNYVIKNKAIKRINKDLYECKGYDLKGIAEYLFPNIKDRKEQYYCSELIAHYSSLDGCLLANGKDNDDVSPYGLQGHEKLKKVEI